MRAHTCMHTLTDRHTYTHKVLIRFSCQQIIAQNFASSNIQYTHHRTSASQTPKDITSRHADSHQTSMHSWTTSYKTTLSTVQPSNPNTNKLQQSHSQPMHPIQRLTDSQQSPITFSIQSLLSSLAGGLGGGGQASGGGSELRRRSICRLALSKKRSRLARWRLLTAASSCIHTIQYKQFGGNKKCDYNRYCIKLMKSLKK
jgi:hypothetical protein